MARQSSKLYNTAVKILLALLIIFSFTRNYKFVYSSGGSMSPTLNDPAVLIIERRADNWKPDRYDIVLIDTTNAGRITKRIIGLPGETLQVIEGVIYVNGNPLPDDPFSSHLLTIGSARLLTIDPIKIPNNSVWVIGDFRSDSVSGIYKIGEITGKSRWILW